MKLQNNTNIVLPNKQYSDKRNTLEIAFKPVITILHVTEGKRFSNFCNSYNLIIKVWSHSRYLKRCQICKSELLILKILKQSSEVFYKVGALKVFTKFTGNKTTVPESLLKTRLWHRCFCVNFAKFSRINLFDRKSPVSAPKICGYWSQTTQASFGGEDASWSAVMLLSKN